MKSNRRRFHSPFRLMNLESRIAPATITVTNSNDLVAPDGSVSLREALNSVNAGFNINADVDAVGAYGNSDKVLFGGGLVSPITLPSGNLVIGKSVALQGPGSGKLTIHNTQAAAETSRVFLINGGTVSISGLTVTGGSTTGSGGGIRSAGKTTLMDVNVSGNLATYGGGIYTVGLSGSLTLIACTISGNKAEDDGGGINIFNQSQPLTLSDTTVADNVAGSNGGGIDFFAGGALVMDRSTVSGNKSNTLMRVINFGGGGGIHMLDASATIRNSTISGNSTNFGDNDSPGGGICAETDSTPEAFFILIQNTTIAFNNAGASHGGGLFLDNDSLGVITLDSTIISNNAAAAGNDVHGKVATANQSLIGNSTGLTISNNNGSQLNVDPHLGALENLQGGLTKYHFIPHSSPAANQGNNNAGKANDQRGPGYLRQEGSATDVGSFEILPAIPLAVPRQFAAVVMVQPDYSFTVTYEDNDADIDISKLDDGDITVSGPGFTVGATFVSATPSANTVTATYKIIPPDLSFDVADNGFYKVSLNANEVFDGDGVPNAVPSATVGTLKVAIAQTLVVNATNDESVDTDAKLSLREALAFANVDANANDLILFDAAVFANAQTITLSEGELKINAAMTISGPGVGVTIDAGGLSRLLYVDVPGLSAQSVSLSNVVLMNGNAGPASGGGIRNIGEALELVNVTVQKCTTMFYGGGISVEKPAGSLNLIGSLVNDNTTAIRGGGVILIHGSAINVFDSTISNNVSDGPGGGMQLFGGTLSMTNSTVSGNKSNTKESGSFYGGGGIQLQNCVATIIQCTISGNSTNSGGKDSPGGGIAVLQASKLTVHNSTIAFNNAGTNPGGGIHDSGSSTITLTSTIVSNNVATTGPDINGAVTATFSLISNTANATITGGNNKLNVSGKLIPLANNGGPTKTHALLAGSSAIDAGSNPAALTVDQRGAGFVRTSGAKIDIGAYEDQRISLAVTNDADSGPGSLRQAILITNDIPGSDSITFDPVFFATAKTITLTSGELQIADAVTIIGPGMSPVTVSGNNASRVFNTSAAAIETSIVVQGLTLTGGKATDYGGAIRVGDESVTLRNCVFSGNEATIYGGAIATGLLGTAKLLIEDCTFSANTAGKDGGAIFGGYGSKSMTIRRSTISGNTAERNGGGVYAPGYSTFLMEDSTVSGNQANGTSGGGGGLFLVGPSAALAVIVRNSTISNNTTMGNGGGILGVYNLSGITVQNSTVTGNTAHGSKGGGGIAGTGLSTYYGYYTTPLLVESSIISGNLATANANEDLFTLANAVANSCGIGTKTGVTTFQPNATTTALLGADFKLSPLGFHGGPTRTHALLPGSAAINKGSNPASLTIDQRGGVFVRNFNGTDIGAFEVQPTSTVTSVLVNGGDKQRSRVTTIDVTFDSVVTLPGAPEAAFRLTRQNGGQVVDLVATVTNGTTTTVTLTFTGANTDSGSLKDGRYTLTVFADMVNGGNFDGNGDATPGDDYQLVGAPNTLTNLFRLFGDSDGSGIIDLTDFGAFRAAYGTALSPFSFDGTGPVDLIDFGQFRTRYGMTV